MDSNVHSLVKAPLISVVVVSWNARTDLLRCLKSIFSSDLDCSMEVIVIDNASSDSTPAHVRKDYPQAILVENEKNVGHTKGVNQAFSLVTGEYVLVLDADTEFPPDMIAGMLKFMADYPDAELATPRTLNTDGTVQESARNLPSVMSGLFGRQSILTEWFPNNPFSKRYLAREFLDKTRPFQVEQISAACMLFRRSFIKDVGPWDERYPGYWVDTDWCAHAISLGKKIYCVPGYELTHHENNAKGKSKSIRRIWMFHYGAFRLYSKWYCLGYLDPRALAAGLLLSLRMLVMIIANLKYLPSVDNRMKSLKRLQ